MDQEAQYLAAIQQAATYNIQGTRLELRERRRRAPGQL